MQLILNSLNEATVLLKNFIADKGNIEKIKQAGDLMSEAINTGKTIFSCGNGGSLCDAMHFAEELTGRFRNNRRPLPAVAISDPSHITCVGNDFGFDYIFSKYVEANGVGGDVLLVISTSGNSVNIVEAVRAARQKGMKVVALTGKKGGIVGPLSDVEIRVPWERYSTEYRKYILRLFIF